MKNRIFLFGWSLLALFRVSGKRIRANSEANRELLRAGVFWKPGEYIENQAQWSGVRFGTKYDMAYGGCSVIAVYNALKSLGQPVTAEDMELLMEYFQRRGAALGGKYGIAPGAILRFLKSRGIEAVEIRADGQAVFGTTFIATVRCGRRLRDWLHTVCITREGRDQYFIHNGYYLAALPGGGSAYRANGSFDSLSGAVRCISPKGVVPVMVLAISVK